MKSPLNTVKPPFSYGFPLVFGRRDVPMTSHDPLPGDHDPIPVVGQGVHLPVARKDALLAEVAKLLGHEIMWSHGCTAYVHIYIYMYLYIYICTYAYR